MFIAERAIGVSLYVGILLITCYLIYRTGTKSTKLILGIYILCISIMAYLYIPAVETDLYRLIGYMQNYASMSYGEFRIALSNSASSNTPASMIYLRLIGMTGVTGLLAGITSLIVFGNIFYIIYNYGKNIYASNKVIAMSLFTVMSGGLYMSAISGIRSTLAFSILVRCFYDEICNEKKPLKNIAWYILACLIHPVAIAAVLIRLIALIIDRISTGKIRSLIAVFMTLPLITYPVIYFGGLVYLNRAINSFIVYTSEVGYTYLWDNILTVLTLIFIALNYIIYAHYQNESKNSNLDGTIKLSYLFTILVLLLCLQHSIFVRFTQLNLLVLLPVIMSNFSNTFSTMRNKKAKLTIKNRLIFYIPTLILIVSMTRGSLSSLKFFVLG
jgi:hypothetical protein